MVHLTSADTAASVSQATKRFPRPEHVWPTCRDGRGAIAWHQRYREAWWILTGKWSLHRAWQHGFDEGHLAEYRRIIVNGGDLLPVIDAAIFAAMASLPNGSMPSEESLRKLRPLAMDRFRRSRTIAR